MKTMIAILPVVLLAACQSTETAAPPSQDACGAHSRQYLIGTRAVDLDRAALPSDARIIHPDTVVTMDYLEHRLNIHVDGEGTIRRLACG